MQKDQEQGGNNNVKKKNMLAVCLKKAPSLVDDLLTK